MTKSIAGVFVWAAMLLAGCAATSRDPVSPVDASAGRSDAAVAEASSDGANEAANHPGAVRLTAAELGILGSVAFRQRFAESYLAETEIEPEVTERERKTLVAAFERIQKDELDEAERLLRDELSPASSAAFDFTLGNIAFQQERLDDAADAYLRAVTKFPKFRRAWGNLGQIRFRQGEFDDAIAALAHVLQLGGGDAITYGLLGVAESKSGHPVAAESAFRMASMMAPDTLDWRLGLAQTFFQQQRFADAIALFGRLIDEHPDRADFWLAQGEAYARTDQPVQAAENFEMVDRLGASTASNLANLGDLYANQELFDLAVNAYLRAMDKDPDAKVDRALRAAKYLAGNGATEETRRLIAGIEAKREGDLAPDEQKQLLHLRARIARADEMGEEEQQALKELVQLDPLDGDALIQLGQYAARTGEREQAIFYYERAESLEDFEADAKVRHAQMLASEGKYAEALPLLRRAQTLEPRDNVQEYLEQVERAAQSR